MIDEIKRYTTMYDQKLNFAVTETEIAALLTDTEYIIEKCNKKLEDAGMSPCDYAPMDEKIARVQRDLDIMKRYVQTTREYIYSKLDQPFQQNFSCNATETLSQIKISELETDNNIALQEYCEIYRQGYTHGYKKVKEKLKFSDFLTIEEVRPGDGSVVLEGMDTIQEFAVLFRPQYNKLMEDVQDISDCAEIILTQGEYNHAEYHPVGNLISSLLDITIVKPIVECFVGRDFITGEELEESQKAVKLAGAAVGLVTLGQSVLVAKGTGMAGKELLGVVGKTVLLDMASMAATYGMGYAGEQLGLPGEVTWILSVATGCTVSMVGGKLLFRDIDKGIIQECTTEDLAKITGEKSGTLDMTQVGKAVSTEEIDIYLQYKKEGSLYRFTKEEREAIQRMQRMDIPDEELKKVLQVKQRTVIENVVNEGGAAPKAGVGNTDISNENFTAKDVSTVKKSRTMDMTQAGKSVTAEEIDIYLQYKKEGSLHRFSKEEREAIQRVQRMDIPDEELKKVLQVQQRTVIENVVNESGSKTPSEIARSWQGTGKYPGIDDYVDITVEKGTVLYRGEPNGTEYFTTLDAIEQSGRDATKLFEGLQVEKNPIHGYRGEMQGYIFNEDVASAYGITNANPQFGKGGLPQYYVPDVQDLIDKGILTPVDNIKLNK